MKNKKMWFILLPVLALMLVAAGIYQGQSETKQEIVFADAGWDSVKLHNAIAGLIAESAYDYTWREVPGSSAVLHEGIIKGEVDVHMEEWTDNLTTYDADIAAGKLQEMGVNFGDTAQGIYVPRYVIEGDAARGLAPLAPDLKTVADLKKYPDVFQDSEQKNKGRIYGAIPGWEVDEVMFKKFQVNGLSDQFIYFRPGSESAMSAAFTAAYEKGEPMAGYYWEPTWLMGKYDFVMLEDAPYDPVLYPEGKTACPSVRVTVGASNKFVQNNPEFCQFLSKYHTTSDLTSSALAHMQDTGDDYNATARWFLNEHPELLDQWLTPEKASLVRASLTGKTVGQNNWFFDFPFALPINVDAFDTAVKGFSVQFADFFGVIKGGLNALIGSVYTLISFIPWWLMIAAVTIGGRRVSGRWRTGILYGVMLFFIGLIGLWPLMYETLSIVLASVVISLALGFPLGVFLATSQRADRIARPILDTMQTMPVFVYLIPAVLFFGLGKAPAVIATTIYAIVPIVKLTSLGIRQVDAEVVEAAYAFGSTKLQSLIKVQIPQAMPTIMTGVNQTMMMAMAMVVTCSMIGATGLGMEVLIGVNRIEIGRGLLAGIAVVIVAILMDRLTQGCVKKDEGQK